MTIFISLHRQRITLGSRALLAPSCRRFTLKWGRATRLLDQEKKILEEIKSHPLLKHEAHDGLVMGNAHEAGDKLHLTVRIRDVCADYLTTMHWYMGAGVVYNRQKYNRQ
ncbi:hypothetical protein OE88DRAFT_1643223 [Heliocybe sulcata]|uniref:Uncharacterized protein n=1 Tax=Heliocybe sulcata TaxID=5364 RepID=A0A5C3N6P4_9AGAM|nr:hypothetical protein OE88DRAFT_1643223 [Heliocybe sulcata]